MRLHFIRRCWLTPESETKTNQYIWKINRFLMQSEEDKMAGDGRVLIRPSGTEPLVRVMIEGTDRDQIAQDAKELAQLIESKFA